MTQSLPKSDYKDLDLLERSKMDLKILQAKLDEYDEYIDAIFSQRDKKISEMKKEISKRNKEISKKNKEIAHLGNLIFQRDEEIKKLQNELEYFKKV